MRQWYTRMMLIQCSSLQEALREVELLLVRDGYRQLAIHIKSADNVEIAFRPENSTDRAAA